MPARACLSAICRFATSTTAAPARRDDHPHLDRRLFSRTHAVAHRHGGARRRSRDRGAPYRRSARRREDTPSIEARQVRPGDRDRAFQPRTRPTWPTIRNGAVSPATRNIAARLVTDGRTAGRPGNGGGAFGGRRERSVRRRRRPRWKPFPGEERLRKLESRCGGVDLTDTISVNECALASCAPRSTSWSTPPSTSHGGMHRAQGPDGGAKELEVRYLGLMRLAQAFGPALRRARAPTDQLLRRLVNPVSVFAAGQLAALRRLRPPRRPACRRRSPCAPSCGRAASRCERFSGPLEPNGTRRLPPKPVGARRRWSARWYRALQAGVEDVFVGDVAEDIRALARQSTPRPSNERGSADGTAGAMASRSARFCRRAVAAGEIEVVDLTHTLSPDFPDHRHAARAWPVRLPHGEVSRYDERGSAWYWNNISMGEHTGTHFDAPVHWISTARTCREFGRHHPGRQLHRARPW